MISRDELLELRQRELDEFQDAEARHKGRLEKIDRVLSMLDDDKAAEALSSVTLMLAPQKSRRSNGEVGRTIPQKVLEAEIRDYLASDEIHTVTQTQIKDEVLKKYPDAKVQSVRSALSNLLGEMAKNGELEFVEKGTAGSPNIYRKKPDSSQVES